MPQFYDTGLLNSSNGAKEKLIQQNARVIIKGLIISMIVKFMLL